MILGWLLFLLLLTATYSINPYAGSAADRQHDSVLFDFNTLNVLEFWKRARREVMNINKEFLRRVISDKFCVGF